MDFNERMTFLEQHGSEQTKKVIARGKLGIKRKDGGY